MNGSVEEWTMAGSDLFAVFVWKQRSLKGVKKIT